MNRIYMALNSGYLKNVIEPIDPRDAKKYQKKEFYIYVPEVN